MKTGQVFVNTSSQLSENSSVTTHTSQSSQLETTQVGNGNKDASEGNNIERRMEWLPCSTCKYIRDEESDLLDNQSTDHHLF